MDGVSTQGAPTNASLDAVTPATGGSTLAAPAQMNGGISADVQPKKRAREVDSLASPAPPLPGGPLASTASAAAAAAATPNADALAHIDFVVYAGYEIRAEYPSPYPLDELPGIASSSSASASTAALSGNAVTGPNSANTNPTRRTSNAAARPGGGRRSAEPSEAPPSTSSQNGLTPSETTGSTRPQKPRTFPSIFADARPISPELGVVTTEQESAATSSVEPPEPLKGDEQYSLIGDESSAKETIKSDGPVLMEPAVGDLNPTLEGDDAEPSAAAETVQPVASTSALPFGSMSADTHASSVPAPSSNTPTSRGNRGRFLPKPAGETVKAKRAAERAARLAAEAAGGPPGPHLTQRQQRELARKAREERDRENKEKQGPQSEVRLLVCDRCFKYMALPAAYLAHQKECQVTKPPGRRVYQRGATSIWEIDGSHAKLYCQNLCLFAKLFIEHKYMFFDVDSFTFYLLTEAMGKQEWVLGYFSKEKISYDDYNLACIVVFPPFRQRGWATLLIEFSYELSRRFSATPGTPERPLSELGQRGYLAFWISVLVRYFRAVFALRDRPPLIESVISDQSRMSLSPSKNSQADDEDMERERKKRLRRSKGWDGELPLGGKSLAHSPAKAFTLRPLPPAPSHAPTSIIKKDEADGDEVFSYTTSLDELAQAVNLRPDDVAYALVESGLARWRQADDEGERQASLDEDVKMEDDEGMAEAAAAREQEPAIGAEHIGKPAPASTLQELELLITPELVEEVAKEKAVKPMPMLDIAYVCNL